jgi:hypothetical protein
MTLKGRQLSFLLEVPSYAIANPPQPGEMIITNSGQATVTTTEQVGRATVIWADYGSGISHPHTQESLLSPEQWHGRQTAFHHGHSSRKADRCSGDNPTKRKRRHSPKGKASGWIEERFANKKRKMPTTYYVYKWEDATGRHSRYIPARKLWRVQQMVEIEGRPIAEVLEVLEVRSGEEL